MKRKLKICGVNTIQSVKASIKADYIGFVFYGKSPRFVNAIKAKELSIYCSEKQKKVGLFVDSENSVIEYIAEYVGLNYIQLHGNENLEKIMYLKEKLKLPIIKSIAISSKEDCHKIKYYENFCDMILLDSKPSVNTLPGGTGKSFDWKIIQDIIFTKDWMLAGGLNEKNIIEALKVTNAPIVDVSSGLESSKGVKCSVKIKKFLEIIKSQESEVYEKN